MGHVGGLRVSEESTFVRPVGETTRAAASHTHTRAHTHTHTRTHAHRHP